MRSFISRRPALVSVVAALALVCGPLSFAPAQAATVVVSGRVVDTAGQPVRYASVNVWVKDEDEGAFVPESIDVETDRTGRYQLVLESGTYRFGVFAGDRYVPEYYNDASRLRDATSVVVGDTSVVLDTVELALRPTVKGTVLSASGGPVPYGYVVAYASDPEEGWVYNGGTEIEADGTYALPVDAGTYRIGFGDEDEDYREEFWDDASSITGAKDVVVDDRGVTGIDAVLTPLPVTPPTTSYGTIQNWMAPYVGGGASVGSLLTSYDGTWSSAPSITRQWLRNGVPIPGATGTGYRLTPADLGASLAVRVTASAPSMNSATRTSPAVGPVRWLSTVSATSKGGRKKATITVRVSSPGPVPRGSVQVRLRGKLVRTAVVRNGRAVITLKKLPKAKARYGVFFRSSDPAVHDGRALVRVKPKKPKKK